MTIACSQLLKEPHSKTTYLSLSRSQEQSLLTATKRKLNQNTKPLLTRSTRQKNHAQTTTGSCSLCSINQTQSICWMLIRSKRHGKVTLAERTFLAADQGQEHGALTHAKRTTHKIPPGALQEQDVLTPTKRENL